MTDTPENDRQPAGIPRWVKVFGIVALVLVVLVVVLVVTGRGGGHGPGRHTQGGDTSGRHNGLRPEVTYQQP
jgi:hypothetical protein